VARHNRLIRAYDFNGDFKRERTTGQKKKMILPPIHTTCRSAGSTMGNNLVPSRVPEPPEPGACIQKGLQNPKQYTDGTFRYIMFTSTGEPSSLAEALENEHWKKAMDEEYEALTENKT
jgi:hypothetical protein